MTAPLAWPIFAAALDALETAHTPEALGAAAAPLMKDLGATLLGLASPLASSAAPKARLWLPVQPPGFADAYDGLPAQRTDVLLDLIVSRTAPFRLIDLFSADVEAARGRYTRLFLAHDLRDGLCVPRLARGGGRELAIVAGPRLNLTDGAATSAARIVLETFAHRSETLASCAASARRTMLTPRQRDCLDAALRGANSIQIAAQLRLSPKTVDAYIAAAAARLGAVNRTAAVGAAVRLGLIG